MSVLVQTERAMVRAMCGTKLMDEKNTDEFINMLGFIETGKSGKSK